MDKKNYEIVDSVEKLEEAIARTREAQKIFATYTQEQVDKIFLAAASAANKARIPLAKMAVEETGMGVVEDKVIKNNYASEYIYNAYKDTKTCGIIEEDKAFGIKKVAEPIGVVAAVIPTTNPTSTAIFKCLLALKTRNAIIIPPHPRAKNCTIAAAFDSNDKEISITGKIKIKPINEFDDFCKNNNIQLGIITVGAGSAQAVCDKMVQCGIVAILNFAPCKLNVPDGVILENENLALSLAYLNNQIK